MKVTDPVTDEFISANKLVLRTQEEISNKFKQITEEAKVQVFDFRAEVLMPYMEFETAKPFLKQDAIDLVTSNVEPWKYGKNEIKAITKEFLDYMQFAWGKATGRRGISAARSIQKLSVWLWILGREDLETLIDDDNLYNPYGAPALVAVCNVLGVYVPDDVRNFAENPIAQDEE